MVIRHPGVRHVITRHLEWTFFAHILSQKFENLPLICHELIREKRIGIIWGP
jgi:hypothetical protein